ncbi:SPFH domain-containing protein [Balamuthia mandrillaris]
MFEMTTRKQHRFASLEEEDLLDEATMDKLTSGEAKVDTTNNATLGSVSVLGVLWNLLWFITVLPIFGSFFTVSPQQHGLVVFWGTLVRVNRTPGMYWFPVFGRQVKYVSTSMQTLDIKRSTVLDQNGNPIVVGGIVTYQITDTVKAAFDVDDYNKYLERQSLAVLKRVCSMYPYEAKNGKSLQSESEEISQILVQLLQRKGDVCGARIISYELADLQYAPEIAQGMLVRQQANALVEARSTIVHGAVSIVDGAIHELMDAGIHISQADQSKLISNLLAVICSESHVQPTFSISESVGGDTEEQIAERRQMMELLQKIAVNTTPAK